MALRTILTDPDNARNARLSDNNELIVREFDYSTTATVKAEVASTGYNLIAPKTGYEIIITAILLYANKSVGAADATVDLYTSDVSGTDTTIKETIIQTEMPTRTIRDLTGLSLRVAAGRWVNVKTDDDDVFATVLYYYIPE